MPASRNGPNGARFVGNGRPTIETSHVAMNVLGCSGVRTTTMPASRGAAIDGRSYAR